ncbi:cytochrome P450 [Streptomyces spiramyceticus]|uniref:cytochrome P450 n=1 Tax=Streptomyces spiramyceticus TaxID=299717 RepID=UPI00237ABEE5|nr:cytochrome P450 [Streptomyces spiramyceticus]
MPSWWERLPTPGNRRFQQAVRSLRAVINTAVIAHRATGASTDTTGGALLTQLLSARDESGRNLSDVQVRDQIVTFLLVGVETTGATLA